MVHNLRWFFPFSTLDAQNYSHVFPERNQHGFHNIFYSSFTHTYPQFWSSSTTTATILINKIECTGMKLTVLQENLNQTLAILTKAIPSKPSLPILTAIKLTATDTFCSACATDLYFGVNTTIVAQVETPGTVVVPGKQFKEIIASLSAGPLTLQFADGTLTIESGKSRTTLQCQSPEEYPPFPDVQGIDLQIDTAILSQIDTQVTFAASSDVARPVLTSVLFAVEPAHTRVVATDGFRLAVLDVPTGFNANQTTAILLPAKSLSEVARLASQRNVTTVSCTVSDELKQARFVVDDVSVYVRLIEGQYPPYEKIMPAEFTASVTFDVEELQNHVKRALVFARESSNIIKFVVTNESVELHATSALLGTYQGVLEQAQFTGQTMEIAFNAKYVQEYLAASKAATIQMEMVESLKPVRFSCAETPGMQYVVMPFKVAG